MAPKIKQSISELCLPEARSSELVIQEMENETLVYDLKSDKAHHLNLTMTLVWKNCNGKTGFPEISKQLSKKLETEVKNDLIWLALAELEKAELLKSSIDKKELKNISRRKVLMSYALPAMTIPVIGSLVTPVLAQGSCFGMFAPCVNPAECCGTMVCEGFSCNP